MKPTNVVYLHERRGAAADSERTALLWENMEASYALWKDLSGGGAPTGCLDSSDDMAAVFAYCAERLLSLRNRSIEATNIEQAPDPFVFNQVLTGLGILQEECEAVMCDRSIHQDVSLALTICVVDLINMRMAAGWNGIRD